MTRSLKIGRALVRPAASDVPYADQWAWHTIKVKQAWHCIEERQAVSNEPLTVAIVDWGIQRDHADLRAELMRPGSNVLSTGNGDPDDDDGHGTMLAGTIAGIVTNIPGGGRAVSPVRLLPVKFIDARTPPTSGNAAKAIACAVEAGARIINASWDVGLNSDELKRAMEYAGKKGVLVVVAAGNEGGNNADYPTFPACFGLSNMMTVMASDEKDGKPGFSNYGRGVVDISAPGVDIISTSPYMARPYMARSQAPDVPCARRYRRYSGTSPAAAHVSGAAAVLLSINPRWTAQQIRDCLIGSADRIAKLERFCREGRRLNLHRAVEHALQNANGTYHRHGRAGP
jgi:subtilisin family serine protease